MRVNYHNAGWVIWTTFIIALMLSILPMPEWATAYRPMWVLVTLIYWAVAVPERVGIGVGWGMGLLSDALTDSLLGQNALALAIVAWLSQRLSARLQVVGMLQQMLVIALLVVVHQLVLLFISSLSGTQPYSLEYWLPVLSSAIVWPWMLSLLRDLRKRFRVK